MERNRLQDIEVYRQHVFEGSSICTTYELLLRFVAKLRSDLPKRTDQYRVGNLSPGYMDYTYFAFYDEYLRSQQLRFGIVLNHHQMQFELWLMAQNAERQVFYWEKLKELEWNREKVAMPRYTVLDTVIEANPDFSDLDKLADSIVEKTLLEVERIYPFLG